MNHPMITPVVVDEVGETAVIVKDDVIIILVSSSNADGVYDAMFDIERKFSNIEIHERGTLCKVVVTEEKEL